MAISGSVLHLSEITWVQFSSIVTSAIYIVTDVLLVMSNSLKRISVLIGKAWTAWAPGKQHNSTVASAEIYPSP